MSHYIYAFLVVIKDKEKAVFGVWIENNNMVWYQWKGGVSWFQCDEIKFAMNRSKLKIIWFNQVEENWELYKQVISTRKKDLCQKAHFFQSWGPAISCFKHTNLSCSVLIILLYQTFYSLTKEKYRIQRGRGYSANPFKCTWYKKHITLVLFTNDKWFIHNILLKK